MYALKRFFFSLFISILILNTLPAAIPGHKIEYEKWINDWLLCGPFPNPLAEGVSEYRHDKTTLGYYIDYLKPIGGETAVKPDNGLKFTSVDGKSYQWRLYHSKDDYIDLFSIIKNNQGVVAYAASELIADKAQEAVLAVGSNDGVKIWLNGSLIWDNHLPRLAQKDEDLIRVKLNAGRNLLLLKVDQGSGKWGFFVRLLTIDKGKALLTLTDNALKNVKLEGSRSEESTIIVMGRNSNYLILDSIPKYKTELHNAEDRILQRQSAFFGDSLTFAAANLPNGPYWIKCSAVLPDKQTVNKEYFFYHGKSKDKILVYDEKGRPALYRTELLDKNFQPVENGLIQEKDSSVSILRPDISPFYVRFLIPSPSLGYRWFLADNGGKGFRIPAGGNITIDLAKEAAKTLIRELNESVTDDTPHWIKQNISCRLERINKNGLNSLQILNLLSTAKSTLVQKNGLTVWYAPGVEKIAQNEPVPPVKNDTVHLSLARNEYEPFQLVLNPDKDIKNLSVKLSDLSSGKNILPAVNMQILDVEYIKIKTVTDIYGSKGFWPDPLPPLKNNISIKKGQNHPLWINVHALKNQKAGIYKGKIILSGEGISETVIPLEVKVYDFALPDEPSIETAYGVSVNKKYHGNLSEKQWRETHDLYMRLCAEHRISPYSPQAGADIKIKYDGAPLKPNIDYSEFDKAMSRYLDDFKFTSFRISSLPAEIMGHKRYSQAYNHLFKLTYHDVQEHLRKKGWLDKAYWYWVDEPPINDYPEVKKGMELLKEACPDMRRLLTCNNEDAPIPYFFKTVNLWVPIMDRYNLEAAHARQKLGEKVWWYVCTGPKGPYPNNFIDHPAINHRIRFWMIDKFDLDGSLYWSITYWAQNPWESAMSYSPDKGMWGNGDGRLLYPPRKTMPTQAVVEPPVTSIRFENLRDGMEDIEYLKLLRRIDKQLTEDVEERLIKTMTVFEQNPLILMIERAQIGRTLERN